MTDRRNRRDPVIAVIGSSAACILIAVLLAGQASPQQTATALLAVPLQWAFPATWHGNARGS